MKKLMILPADNLSQLKSFLPLAKKVIDSSSTLPILKYACITNDLIRVTDFENILVVPFKSKNQYCLLLKTLGDILKTNPSKINFGEVKEDKIKISFDSFNLTCPTRSVDEFPLLPKEEKQHMGSWTKGVIEQLYKQTCFCSKDELKPSLTGVWIEQEKQIKSCATDGHRLQYINNLDSNKLCEISDSFNGIMPVKSLELLNQIKFDQVRIFKSEFYLSFEFENEIILYSKLIDGQFPDFIPLCEENKTNKVKFSKNEMLKSLLIAEKFANKTTFKGSFQIGKNQVNITTTDLESNSNFETIVPILNIEQSQEEMTIGFNIEYLERVISSISENEVIWSFSNPISASFFVGLNNTVVQNLLMPIRLT